MRLLPVVLLLACTPTAPPSSHPGGPRGLRATEHRELATEHEASARRQESFPNTAPMFVGDSPAGVQPLAWYRSWDPAADHARLARIHWTKAAVLEAAYAEACGTRDSKTIMVSPLTRHPLGSWNTSAGVVAYLSPLAGTAETLLADLKCHRAWMMLAPSDTMDDCPLDLPALRIDARGDDKAITLVITVTDRRLVAELQRRVAKQVEQTSHEH